MKHVMSIARCDTISMKRRSDHKQLPSTSMRGSGVISSVVRNSYSVRTL